MRGSFPWRITIISHTTTVHVSTIDTLVPNSLMNMSALIPLMTSWFYIPMILLTTNTINSSNLLQLYRPKLFPSPLYIDESECVASLFFVLSSILFLRLLELTHWFFFSRPWENAAHSCSVPSARRGLKSPRKIQTHPYGIGNGFHSL